MTERRYEIYEQMMQNNRDTLRQIARDNQLSPGGTKVHLASRITEHFLAGEESAAKASQELNELAQANAAAAAEAARPVVTVVVLGSYAWESRAYVSEQLINWWVGAGQPPVQLVTGGSPAGAEAFAREVAEAHGWAVTSMRDEALTELAGYIGFAFIRDASQIEDVVLELAARSWWRIFRDDTSRIVSRWASR